MYTHNAFDFSVLGNTPITFPIDWHNSKIPGFALRADVPNFHNLSINDDKHPPRIQEHSLFDLSLGQDNLFNGDKRKVSLRLTDVNITNKYALYNFLSTFSRTHYVTPRALTAEIGSHF